MKSLVNPLQVSRFLRMYDDAAAQRGIKLSLEFDFRKYVSIVQTTPTKEPTSRIFQLDRSPIKSGDGFWMRGVDKNNEIVILQAIRLFDLSRSNFAEHLLNVFSADSTLHAHPQDSWTCIAPSAEKMTGKVCYHGDAWVRRDYRGGMPKIMTGVAFGASFAMWAPDFVCGLVPNWLLDKGLVAQYGYPHHEAGGLQPVQQNALNDYLLLWVTGEELRSRVDRHDPTKLS
ncbi:hypothetical protein [Bradyrhizobium zhanjiangense]|uniref:Uncharacterized protein n=1 Tax=Bradyrhizobium zhanjiangense TaxID=1325107 RepID=A0A4Q0Q3R8_9BRAD|nr:hypothetical protein [Bradyrhizobium zhanjiangense]RXG83567.1 hypothetical protein EAS61_41850 [Bradyrhizobium zhanjiangense]